MLPHWDSSISRFQPLPQCNGCCHNGSCRCTHPVPAGVAVCLLARPSTAVRTCRLCNVAFFILPTPDALVAERAILFTHLNARLVGDRCHFEVRVVLFLIQRTRAMVAKRLLAPAVDELTALLELRPFLALWALRKPILLHGLHQELVIRRAFGFSFRWRYVRVCAVAAAAPLNVTLAAEILAVLTAGALAAPNLTAGAGLAPLFGRVGRVNRLIRSHKRSPLSRATTNWTAYSTSLYDHLFHSPAGVRQDQRVRFERVP